MTPIIKFNTVPISESPITGEPMKFRYVGPVDDESMQQIYDAVCRLNSEPWRGFPEGSVILRTWKGQRLESGDWDLETEFWRFNPEHPLARAYGRADFNRLEVGSPVP